MTAACSRVPKSILLKGYYGFGNFGDDLLLISAERILRDRFPDARISVFSNFNERLPGFSQFHGYQDYLRDLISGPVEILDWSMPGQFDLIVHGGGGVFLPPTNQGEIAKPLGVLARRLGARKFAALAGIVRRATARQRRQTARRSIAIGVGLGSYCPGSRRSVADLEVLGGLDRIAVRDAGSLAVARSIGLGSRTASFTDLAFALDLPQVEKQAPASRHVGLVMCDGKPFNDIMGAIIEQPGAWRATPVILDENHDGALAARLIRDGRSPLVWRPNDFNLEQFCHALGSFDLVVTSRAHGAIAASLMGVPAILLDTDFKLRSVQTMLPNGTMLASPESRAALVAAMDDAMVRRKAMLRGLQADVAEQRSRIERMNDFVFG